MASECSGLYTVLCEAKVLLIAQSVHSATETHRDRETHTTLSVETRCDSAIHTTTVTETQLTIHPENTATRQLIVFGLGPRSD